MSEVPQIWRTMLDAMPSGWTTPAALASRVNRDQEETMDLLAALDEAGLISVRDLEDGHGPVVSLSPRGLGAVRAAAVRSASRDRRADGAWSPDYRPNRARTAATATASVAS